MNKHYLLLFLFLLVTGCSQTDYLGRARKAREENNLPLALQFMDKALRKDPGNDLYLLERGRIYMEMQKYEDAYSDLLTLTCSPYALEANLKLGILFYEVTKAEQETDYLGSAINYLEDAISLNNTSSTTNDTVNFLPEINYWLGKCYQEEEEYELAYSAYKHSLLYGEEKAVSPFIQTANMLGWPAEITKSINIHPGEIQFTDGTTAFLTQELDISSAIADYEFISIESKQLEVDYIQEEFRSPPSIHYFLCKDYFIFNPERMSDYYQITSQGKEIGVFWISLMENERPYLLADTYENRQTPLHLNVWLWKFRTNNQEIAFITGIPASSGKLLTPEEARTNKKWDPNVTDYQLLWEKFHEEGILVVRRQGKIKIVSDVTDKDDEGTWPDKNEPFLIGYNNVLKYIMRDNTTSLISSLGHYVESCAFHRYYLDVWTTEGICRDIIIDGITGKVLQDHLQGRAESIEKNAIEIESMYAQP